MNTQRLSEIKERAEKATVGPWRSEADEQGHFVTVFNYDHGEYFAVSDKADAEFVAHARQDVPDLIAEVERLKGILSVCYDEYADLDSRYKKSQKRLKEVENLFRITDDVLRKEYNKNENLREALDYAAQMLSIGENRLANKRICGALGIDEDFYEEEE